MSDNRSAPDRQRQALAIAWRDWGLQRLRRLTAAVVTAAALAAAGLTALAASAKPGAKSHPAAATRTPGTAQVTLPGAVPRHHRRHSRAASAGAPQPIPVTPAPQPPPVAPQQTPEPPVSSSGGS